MTREDAIEVIRKEYACDDAISLEAVIEWLKDKDIIKLFSQEETARKELKALSQEPCDAISRDAVIKDFTQWRGKMAYSFGEDYSGVSVLDKAIRVVKGMPPVTQKSETGHWINLEKKYKGQVLPFWGRYGCSKCGGYGEGTFNYCPNCGARMESEE